MKKKQCYCTKKGRRYCRTRKAKGNGEWGKWTRQKGKCVPEKITIPKVKMPRIPKIEKAEHW